MVFAGDRPKDCAQLHGFAVVDPPEERVRVLFRSGVSSTCASFVVTARHCAHVRRVVAIHQPNFLPWLGWFEQLARADVLVLLDATQFPRTSRGTWMNRVQLLINGQPRWVTVPVVRAGRGTQDLRDVRVDDAQPWREKLLRTIQLSYARAPFFDRHFPLVQEILGQRTDRLTELNQRGVRRLAEELGLDPAKLTLASGSGARRVDRTARAAHAVGGWDGVPQRRRCRRLPGRRSLRSRGAGCL